jgi:hypothetical protein
MIPAGRAHGRSGWPLGSPSKLNLALGLILAVAVGALLMLLALWAQGSLTKAAKTRAVEAVATVDAVATSQPLLYSAYRAEDVVGIVFSSPAKPPPNKIPRTLYESMWSSCSRFSPSDDSRPLWNARLVEKGRWRVEASCPGGTVSVTATWFFYEQGLRIEPVSGEAGPLSP